MVSLTTARTGHSTRYSSLLLLWHSSLAVSFASSFSVSCGPEGGDAPVVYSLTNLPDDRSYPTSKWCSPFTDAAQERVHSVCNWGVENRFHKWRRISHTRDRIWAFSLGWRLLRRRTSRRSLQTRMTSREWTLACASVSSGFGEEDSLRTRTCFPDDGGLLFSCHSYHTRKRELLSAHKSCKGNG